METKKISWRVKLNFSSVWFILSAYKGNVVSKAFGITLMARITELQARNEEKVDSPAKYADLWLCCVFCVCVTHSILIGFGFCCVLFL
jgi:hypothetical protein